MIFASFYGTNKSVPLVIEMCHAPELCRDWTHFTISASQTLWIGEQCIEKYDFEYILDDTGIRYNAIDI